MNQRPVPGVGIPKTPGIAIASVVLGGLGLFLACLTGIPAAICGHVALSRIDQSNGALGGRGVAITGMVLGYVGIAWSLLAVPILASLTVPVFSSVQERGQETRLVNNARQIYMGCALFAADHDGVWPERLEQLVEEMIFDSPELFEVPVQVDAERAGEGMFRLLVPGQAVEGLDSRTPVIVSTLPVSQRPRAKWVVVYADGATMAVPRSELVASGLVLEE